MPLNNAWNELKHRPYAGPLPDFTGQLRCGTGIYDLGKHRIILIPESQFESKKAKYPALHILERVS
jgi:hypothetical protein